MTSNRRASLAVVFGIVLLDLLGFGILIPQLGVYGVRFDGSPFAVGLLLTVYSLMQFLFAPLLGRLSDRYGRRPVLLYSVAGSMVGYLLFAFADSLEMLFLARIVDGISGGNISTAQAYVADITTVENRARGMGLVGAAFGIGFLCGPAVGGLLGSIGGNRAIGLFAAALAFTNLVLAFFFLPESHRERGAARTPWRLPLSGILERIRVPVAGRVLLLFLLFTVAFAQMEGTFSVFLLTQHLARGVLVPDGLLSVHSGATDELAKQASLKVSYVFATVGLVSALIQGGLIGRLKARFGEANLAVAGMVAAAAGIGLIPAAPSYAWFFAPVVVMAAGSALVNPSLSALISIHSPKERQGEMLGAYQSMGSLGRIVGPALGGFLFTVSSPAAPYVVSCALLLLGTMVALRLVVALRAPSRL